MVPKDPEFDPGNGGSGGGGSPRPKSNAKYWIIGSMIALLVLAYVLT